MSHRPRQTTPSPAVVDESPHCRRRRTAPVPRRRATSSSITHEPPLLCRRRRTTATRSTSHSSSDEIPLPPFTSGSRQGRRNFLNQCRQQPRKKCLEPAGQRCCTTWHRCSVLIRVDKGMVQGASVGSPRLFDPRTGHALQRRRRVCRAHRIASSYRSRFTRLGYQSNG